MKKHLNILVKGQVQGVFFRASAVKEAVRLGIKGFTRNERNGDVYIEAEGDENTLQAFLNWCANGPPMAVVYEVKTDEGEMKEFKGFEIRR